MLKDVDPAVDDCFLLEGWGLIAIDDLIRVVRRKFSKWGMPFADADQVATDAVSTAWQYTEPGRIPAVTWRILQRHYWRWAQAIRRQQRGVQPESREFRGEIPVTVLEGDEAWLLENLADPRAEFDSAEFEDTIQLLEHEVRYRKALPCIRRAARAILADVWGPPSRQNSSVCRAAAHLRRIYRSLEEAGRL